MNFIPYFIIPLVIIIPVVVIIIKNNDKEQSLEKKPKNENSTTISENVQSNCSKLNEMGEFKNSMSEENKSIQ